MTARHVQWIFAERLAGRSVAGIARELNERSVPCPSAADPGRNRHRGGQGWNLRSVAVILANPRYTGREVWHRHQCATPGEGRSMIPAEWAISWSWAHPLLVSEADFVAAQQIRAARVNDDGAVRRYQLAGLIRCGPCGRLMDAHWVNGRAGYRRRHGHNSAGPAPPDRPKHLYVREDKLLIELGQRQLVDGNACASDAFKLVALLRSQSMVIVHTRAGWTVAEREEV